MPDEELEEEARVLEKVRKKAAIVATSVHETANLSNSDEPVCTTGPREEPSLSSYPNMKYEPALISESGREAIRCKWRDGTIAISKRIAGERRIGFRPNAKQNIPRRRKIRSDQRIILFV